MKTKIVDSDLAKKIAITYFNKTWDYLDKSNRTPLEVCEMLNCAHTSLLMWKNVETCTNTNLSIGYWQISRVYAVLNESNLAKLYSERCIEISKNEDVDSFYLAYGYEALARSNKIDKKYEEMKENIKIAKEVLINTKEKEIQGLIQELNELENF